MPFLSKEMREKYVVILNVFSLDTHVKEDWKFIIV